MNHMAEQFSYRTWFDKWHQIYKETTNENNLINETLSQVIVNPNVIQVSFREKQSESRTPHKEGTGCFQKFTGKEIKIDRG